MKLTQAQLGNITLSTSTVENRESISRLQLNGVLTVDQRRSYRVTSILDGIVFDVKAVTHEQVSKGKVLARLRSHALGQAQGEYLEALALFELAQSERERVEALWKDGLIAESRWRKIESQYKTAQAVFQARRRMLSMVGMSAGQIKRLDKQPKKLAEINLVSPIDGMVTGMNIEAGQLLEAGQAAFHIDDLSVLWAEVKIPVANLSQLAIGTEAVLHVQVWPDKPYKGKLLSLGSQVDERSQTLSGRIVLDNKDGTLRPGMYVKATLDSLGKRGLVVPASAVFRVGDQAYVFKTLDQGRFEPTPVSIGVEVDGWIPVYTGLETGAEVVSEGVAELKSHWQYSGGE
ncbi:MAG: efflux RND transporter periplasmic adaptor subunit [Robiginitomaculum sp.]|nr:efflux RND transporter periplasmic adaptor subunit [Robiginitomaculum sp.]